MRVLVAGSIPLLLMELLRNAREVQCILLNQVERLATDVQAPFRRRRHVALAPFGVIRGKVAKGSPKRLEVVAQLQEIVG